MNEEKIIKILLCENIGELAICGLLDLLTDENNYDLNVLQKEATKQLIDLYKKEKNKQILGDNIENFRKLFAEEFSKQFVSKDKIREKIKELEQIQNTALTETTIEIMNYKIDILNQLLKESE